MSSSSDGNRDRDRANVSRYLAYQQGQLDRSRAKEIPRLEKVVMFALECNLDLTAQYNPKEIQLEKSVEWKPSANKKADKPDLEFGASTPRTLSMELMFATYEEGVRAPVYVQKLLLLASVMKPDGTEMEKRPSLVQVRWGNPDLPVFEGVVQSVSTKLTMFLPSGTPVRATCNVKMMEAQRSFRADRKKGTGKPPPPGPATRW